MCIKGKHKSWYVPIVSKYKPQCNNLGIVAYWKYILRDTCHVIHVASLVYVTLNLNFRLLLNFYVPCVKCQSDDVITTWINSLFVKHVPQMEQKQTGVLNNTFLWTYRIMQIWEQTVANFCILLVWTLCEPWLPRNFFPFAFFTDPIIQFILVGYLH